VAEIPCAVKSDSLEPFFLGRGAEVWRLVSADGHAMQFAPSLSKHSVTCPRCGGVLKLPVVPHQGVETCWARGATLLDVTGPFELEDRLRLDVIEQLVQ